MIEVLFWGAAGLLAYLYVGYPALITVLGRLRPDPWRCETIEPAVTVVVVAHDEGARIRNRVENLLALDYPPERLEVVVASDGSTDDTVRIVREIGAPNVRVVELSPRRGKPAVLNEVVPTVSGEIVVLADSRQCYDRETLRALVAPLADARVGAVSGELMLETPPDRVVPGGVGEGIGFYWRYEKLIRERESLYDSTVGATGAIYAIRRGLFETIPADTLLDDVLIPLNVVRRGYRVVFESAARAWDAPASTPGEEFTRKVRTIAGNFQLFARHTWLFDPRRNRLFLQTMSHKVLRLLAPVLLGVLAVTSLAGLDRPGFRIAAAAQGCFYAAAALGRSPRFRSAPFHVPYVFCLLNWATVVAFARWLTGRQRVTWDRQP